MSDWESVLSELSITSPHIRGELMEAQIQIFYAVMKGYSFTVVDGDEVLRGVLHGMHYTSEVIGDRKIKVSGWEKDLTCE